MVVGVVVQRHDHPSRKRGRRYYYYSCLSRSTGFVRNGFNLGGKCLGVLHVDNYPLFLKLCIIIIHSLTHIIIHVRPIFISMLFFRRKLWMTICCCIQCCITSIPLFHSPYIIYLNFIHTSSFTLHRTKKKSQNKSWQLLNRAR